METNNQKEELSAKKAQLMASRLRYYSAQNRTDEFATLPGHIQRAIEREANFQLDSMVKSDSYVSLLNKETSEELFKAHCEYYAHIGNEQEKINPYNPNNLFRRLVERDSKDNQTRNLSFHSDSFNNKTTRHASSIDQKVEQDKKTKSPNNIQEHIQQMLRQKQIRNV